jgi:hypothetical protein
MLHEVKIRVICDYGTEGRTRTDTVLPLPDFESGASTNFATPALVAGL